MSDSMTVFGQCLAVQFQPACISEGNTAPLSSDGGRTKRAHVLYRSLRNLTRGGTLPKAVANAVRSKSVERPRISCPSSPSKRNSRGESDLLTNKEKASSDDAFIDRCMNNIELNSQDVNTANSSNQPDVVQSTPNVTKDKDSVATDDTRQLNGSLLAKAPSADAEDEPFATLKKSSPSRRSSFFNAIHASLPPICSTASNVPQSVRSPTKSVTSQSKSPNKNLPSDSKSSPHRISTEVSSSHSKSLDCPGEGTQNTSVHEVCHNGTLPQAEVPGDTETSSGTPTPTNAEVPRPPGKASTATPEPSLLFQNWVNANSVCYWDPELVAAVGSLKLVGALLGGWLLVSGSTRALATVLHAHTHSLLRPPPDHSIASLGGHVRVFVDEKKFVVDEVANRRNTRVVAYDPSEVPPVMQSKNPASVMVFAAVASDGKVMPPHFIEAGLKINTAEYLKILKDVLMPWIRRNYDPFKVMLVQDSAPAHGAKKVQDFLKENLPLMVPKAIWPSSSPDLNVCDYWLFGVIEEKSNVTSHPSVNSLKSAIRRAFRNLDPEDVKRSCSRFRSRISQIIDAKGSHIE
ncbi:hypothetical protein FHG87_016621 [Trinorchestia longiramus]|nr:hypothetical protein FHG87_016621 [Trinorchestia longiramus]